MAVLGTFQAQDRTIQAAATVLACTQIELTMCALMPGQRVRQTPVAPMLQLEAFFEPGAGVRSAAARPTDRRPLHHGPDLWIGKRHKSVSTIEGCLSSLTWHYTQRGRPEGHGISPPCSPALITNAPPLPIKEPILRVVRLAMRETLDRGTCAVCATRHVAFGFRRRLAPIRNHRLRPFARAGLATPPPR